MLSPSPLPFPSSTICYAQHLAFYQESWKSMTYSMLHHEWNHQHPSYPGCQGPGSNNTARQIRRPWSAECCSTGSCSIPVFLCCHCWSSRCHPATSYIPTNLCQSPPTTLPYKSGPKVMTMIVSLEQVLRRKGIGTILRQSRWLSPCWMKPRII